MYLQNKLNKVKVQSALSQVARQAGAYTISIHVVWSD